MGFGLSLDARIMLTGCTLHALQLWLGLRLKLGLGLATCLQIISVMQNFKLNLQIYRTKRRFTELVENSYLGLPPTLTPNLT